MQRANYDLTEVKQAFTMVEMLKREGFPLRRQGARFVMSCPFHEERSASFGTDGQRPYHAHCFGCGWDGSVVDYWMQSRDVDLATAIQQIAGLANLAPLPSGTRWGGGKMTPVSPVTLKEDKTPPALPRLRYMTENEIAQLAKARGLSVEGVRLAAMTFKRAAFCLWPQYQDKRGDWHVSDTAVPSWCMTDEARKVAEFRRLDNLKYPTHSKNEAGQWVLNDEKHWIKAWSTRGKKWPLGTRELGERKCVAWVKGGPDMLAAYHFLHGFGQLHRVAVVAMLGESARIAEEALPYFAGCRVRIFFDADEVREKTVKRADGTTCTRRTRPGFDACARWTEQLTEAGAVVKGFSFADMPDEEAEAYEVPECIAKLRRADGKPVKDLNDLALCNAEVVGHELIESAFVDWNF